MLDVVICDPDICYELLEKQKCEEGGRGQGRRELDREEEGCEGGGGRGGDEVATQALVGRDVHELEGLQQVQNKHRFLRPCRPVSDRR